MSPDGYVAGPGEGPGNGLDGGETHLRYRGRR